MIVRESPTPTRARVATQWPPQSPRAALLSSPSRQRKLEQRNRHRSTSPSPLKPRRGLDMDQVPNRTALPEGSEDVEEDEETLQLRLEALQAQLKLKQLRKAKAQAAARDDSGPGAPPKPHTGSAAAALKERQLHSNVQVPLSPKSQHNPRQPESPRRVQLGIDKGLKAQDVSLTKAKTGPYNTQPVQIVMPKPAKSFSERLAESRVEDIRRQTQNERRDQSRSKGFGVRQTQQATEVFTTREPEPMADVVLGHGSCSDMEREADEMLKRLAGPRRRTKPLRPSKSDGAEPEFRDSFVGFNLTKRFLTPAALTEVFSDKALISIPRLLKEVVSPDYDPPDVESDYVVVGVIARKSTPRDRAITHRTKSNADPDEDPANARAKFMVLKLTDFKWELDLFLFDSAFDRFWKLTEGTVIAILNPMIMPPKPHRRDTGAFSLKLTSSEDTVLEIGMSKDLGFCRSVKQNGQECMQWLDKRKTEFCEFHVSLKVDKARASRMEINGMASYGLFGRNNTSKSKKGDRYSKGRWGKRYSPPHVGEFYDKYLNETSYIIPKQYSTGLSTAGLLDADDKVHGGLSAAERSQKRLAAMEKELDLAKKLGSEGTGLGGEYMRRHKVHHDDAGQNEQATAIDAEEEQPDAAALGLIGGKSGTVTLSPVKGGRLGGVSKSRDPVGWSSAFKRGLPSPAQEGIPAKRKGEPSPKRARFVLEDSGALQTGKRDSPPTPRARVVLDDDDDDDLDII